MRLVTNEKPPTAGNGEGAQGDARLCEASNSKWKVVRAFLQAITCGDRPRALALLPKEDDAAQARFEDELCLARQLASQGGRCVLEALHAVETGRKTSDILREFSRLPSGLDYPLGRFRIVGAA